MSGLQARGEDMINGVDVREQGNALRVATNTPHLVSLGTGRLSTAVTLHPIKQGRVTIGSDPTCDIYVVGTGVASVHCRVENSHGVVTLYPISGSTLLDGLSVDKPTRLSQGSMLTIGRSNYLRFNHPEEAKLMKSVLPSVHVSMAPVQFQPNEMCLPAYPQHQSSTHYQNVQKSYKENTLSQLDQELDMTIKDLARKKPPVAPRKPYRDFDDSSSDQERPKVNSIMAKVSKFEYYAKQHKVGKSQFYTNENEISPKVFSSNSLTVNTPAKDVLGGKAIPKYMKEKVTISENNSSGSYANVAIRKTKIEDIVRNFDENSRLPKKVNNDQSNIYGKINNDRKDLDDSRDFENIVEENDLYGRIDKPVKRGMPSPAFDRNPQYAPVYANYQFDRNVEAENMRIKAYQDRIKEEEQKEAETARLEEILNMCAEYERQITSGLPITPTEKRPHNKIITNGSLPRNGAYNNPNFVQTSEGYYKFETSHSRNNSVSQSLPNQRNVSSYENYDIHEQLTPEVTIRQHNNYENVGRMDEIGIPVYDESPHELSSPIMIRKLQNGERQLSTSPIGSPYENVYYNRGMLKPKSPNTQSPRTRIKTTFAHKNLPSPQYFVFPIPPVESQNQKPNFDPKNQNVSQDTKYENAFSQNQNMCAQNKNTSTQSTVTQNLKQENRKPEKVGIEKQLSLEEEIPMIDDADISNDIELRYSKIDKPGEQKQVKRQEIDEKTIPSTHDEKQKQIKRQETNEKTIPAHDEKQVTEIIQVSNKRNSLKDDITETKVFIERETELLEPLQKNKSFDDVKKELMADIPELEEFEKDLKENKREQFIKNISEDIRRMDIDDSIDSLLDDNLGELKTKYDKLKEERKKLVTDIHEIKNKMSEIRSQEDDILRELEMEKALIKGEYDSEIAILNIEQKKKADLIEKSKSIEEEYRKLKEKQEARQNEMRDRVEIATLKVERIEKDLKDNAGTVEELQNAQDILDNETKIYEDLEFQHLEEESELLANREDIQNEIILLTKKIEAQKSRILTLKSEANDNLTSALDETKVLQAEYRRLLNQVEELTRKVQMIEKELKPLVTKLNDIERTQSPDSAFYTDQTRAKSGEFGYSPQTSDSDDLDIIKVSNFEDHTKQINDKFNSIDRMSQSMIVDIERRVITDIVDEKNESPTKSSTSKEKKGFWERNFDSLKRKKKPKSPEKIDIMSQSLNENMFYNNENIEQDPNPIDKFNSLRNSKKKTTGPVKSSSSSKIPTFAALGKIIKKDSFGKKTRENDESTNKNRYTKSTKPTTDNKYIKAKSLSPEKQNSIKEESETVEKSNNINNINDTEPKMLHRKSCGDEPNVKISEFQRMTDSGKIPSQDDIDRISKVTMDAPLFSSDTDMNSLGKRTLDSLMEIERKRMEMLEEQGCQVIENEREKISELKKRVQDETKKLWDQKYREQSKSVESDCSQNLSNDKDQIDPRNNRSYDYYNDQDNINHIDNRNVHDTDHKNVHNYNDVHGYKDDHKNDDHGYNDVHGHKNDVHATDHKNVHSYNDVHGHKNDVRGFNDHRNDGYRNDVNRSDKMDDHKSNVHGYNDVHGHKNDGRGYVSDHRNDGYRNDVSRSDNTDDHKNDVHGYNDVHGHKNDVRGFNDHRNDGYGNDVSRSDKMDDTSLVDDSFNMTSSTIFEESSGFVSSSIEELQVRNSRTESTEDEKRSETDSRPLSHVSDFSRDNIPQLVSAPRRSRRGVAPYSDFQRPLTRYLPVDRDDFDLRRHVESAGHQIELCPYVTISSTSCRGYLHKLGAKFHTWSKRWFVFDRETKTFVYYWDKSEKKARGGAYFQVIEEVYLDHGNTSKSPSPQTTFIVKTRQRRYYLMAPSGESARIWIDVIFTGAQGYTEYLE